MYTSRIRLIRSYPSTIRIRARAPLSSTSALNAPLRLKLKSKRSSSSLKASSNVFRLRAPASLVQAQTRSVASFSDENASAALGVARQVVQRKRASLKLRLSLPKVLPRPVVDSNRRLVQMQLSADVPIAYAKDKLAEVGPLYVFFSCILF